MPDETAEHARTFMGWPTAHGPWESYLPDVRRDVAGVARAVADFEPVVLVAQPDEADAARTACGGAVDVLPLPIDDLWMRDTGPTFVLRGDQLAGVDTNFNGWGDKAPHPRDGRLAARMLAAYGVERVPAELVAEGGSLEVDGAGTLMTTESSLVNDNRNPGRTRDELEAELKALLGVQKVIWFPGVRDLDITDGHVDGMVRFARPGTVVLNRPAKEATADEHEEYDEAREIVAASTDATGRTPDVVDLPAPDPAAIGRRGPDFFAGYVNYYVVNGGVVMPAFGDRPADERARGILADLYPGRRVVQVRIDTLGEGGGGIHCATQQQPALAETS